MYCGKLQKKAKEGECLKKGTYIVSVLFVNGSQDYYKVIKN